MVRALQHRIAILHALDAVAEGAKMNVLDEFQHITPEQAKQRDLPYDALVQRKASYATGADCMGWRWHYTGGRHNLIGGKMF
jgi:hypothetical protein